MPLHIEKWRFGRASPIPDRQTDNEIENSASQAPEKQEWSNRKAISYFDLFCTIHLNARSPGYARYRPARLERVSAKIPAAGLIDEGDSDSKSV